MRANILEHSQRAAVKYTESSEQKRFKRTAMNSKSRSGEKSSMKSSRSQPLLHVCFIGKKEKLSDGKLMRDCQKGTQKNISKVNPEDFLKLLNGNGVNKRKEQDFLIRQNQRMANNLEKLKKQNEELKAKLLKTETTLKNHLAQNKKGLNKYRDNTQKQRMKQLEKQNAALKEEVTLLIQQIGEMKQFMNFSKITSTSINSEQDSFNDPFSEDQNEQNKKEMQNLKEQVQRMEMKIDFMNRRSFNEEEQWRVKFQTTIRQMKEKIQILKRENIFLKEKNFDLCKKINRMETKNSTFLSTDSRVKHMDSLLSLSSED